MSSILHKLNYNTARVPRSEVAIKRQNIPILSVNKAKAVQAAAFIVSYSTGDLDASCTFLYGEPTTIS